MHKLLLLLIAAITATTSLTAQMAPAIQWQRCLGGTGYDGLESMIQTKDGGYILTGTSDSANGDITYNHGNGDCWVVKLNNMGAIQWQKSYGGSLVDGGVDIKETADGGYIVAAITNSHDGDITGFHSKNPETDYWILKLDNVGNLQWQKCYGGTLSEYPSSIIQTPDKGYIIAGITDSNDGDVNGNHNIGLVANYDWWVVKIDSVGKLEWQKCLGGSEDDRAYRMETTTDGSYIIVGYAASINGDVMSNHGGADGWVVKLNNTGNIVWQKCYGGSGSDAFFSISRTTDRDFFLCGESESTDGGLSNKGADCWVMKIDGTGNMIWQTSWGGTRNDFGINIIGTKDGGGVIACHNESRDGDLYDSTFTDVFNFSLVRFDSIGNFIWKKIMGGSRYDEADAIFQTSDGGFLIAGETYSSDGDITNHHGKSYQSDGWIVKLAPETIPIKIIYNTLQLQIFPNPAYSIVGIETKAIQEIRIIDDIGRVYLRQKIVNNTSSPYTYIPIQYLAKGIYIVQALCNDGQIKTGKLVVD